MGRTATIATAVLALCACSAENVRFTERGGNPPFDRADDSYPSDGMESGDVVRVCFDQFGSIYPDPARLHVRDAWLESCGSSVAAYAASERLEHDPDAISADVASRINRRESTELVILIHGINNTYPEARRSYRAARLVIRDVRPDARCTFLEVFWDARAGDALAAWGAARESSKWVGLGLRRILRHLDPSIPVRILTHSRGASVACSALWDVPLRADEAANARFDAACRSIPAPRLADVRAAFLVPAMPADDLVGAGCDRVIVGVNENDPAVGKGALPSAWCGSTSLGCSPEAFETVASRLNRGRAVALRVELSGSGVHDFKDTLLRTPVSTLLLPALLDRREGAR
jgi:hypothetical protein